MYSSSVDYLTSFRGAAPSCPLQGIPTPGCLRFISSMALLFLEMILGDFFFIISCCSACRPSVFPTPCAGSPTAVPRLCGKCGAQGGTAWVCGEKEGREGRGGHPRCGWEIFGVVGTPGQAFSWQGFGPGAVPLRSCVLCPRAFVRVVPSPWWSLRRLHFHVPCSYSPLSP